MLTVLRGGHVVDPATGKDGVGDVWFEDGRIVAPPAGGKADQEIDCTGHIVMAGAIDIHSHIAGGNVNTARLLLPELHRGIRARLANTPLSTAKWSTYETGRLYAQMGFTTVVEPAMAPHHSLQTHFELNDVPILDKGALTVLGNDDFLLRQIRAGEPESAINDYVATTVAGTKSLGLKCINPGGCEAFKENMRAYGLDDEVPFYGLTSRKIFQSLQKATQAVGIHHPLHLHMNNLGIAGNIQTALDTIDAAQGLPLHLAHIQFYAYGKEGNNAFSSAAATFADKINANPNVTVDVGQVMFSQTVTISSDVLKQFNSMPGAIPKKGAIFDGDANGGGIVPYNYKISNYYNAIQWAAGLELFLLIKNPEQVFFTTDHPNGGPFTAYPELFALLMSAELREQVMARLPAEALQFTTLPSLKREYTYYELAQMSRSGAAKLFGFTDRGTLAAGAVADVAVYKESRDKAGMFRRAAYVFKDGDLVVKDGEVSHYKRGKTLHISPRFDNNINKRLDSYYEELYGLPRGIFDVPDAALPHKDAFAEVACKE
ncbi:formylmethanofuran dehydrogenase subunit A [Methylocystis iwaonis]|uniref:Formylmethanofuran dehydrogenase subunit A n=1 Tax=Methylocystis iwaonis TaxID=2885079 RepID=A0ABN6VKI2_9HYPH|nr:formylmethanofuran dehydrogenase subunit A [Methylocystis iwaonis]BDV35090.1 formylmethanofuran dehydrogenase subunit A [Methylocystis iwaonis]